MRSLKFRFWNTLTGEYEEHSDLFFVRGDGAICSNDSVENNLEAEQYTGLKDKNGKEIYEGDIVRSWGTNYEVKFCEMQDSDCSYFYQGWGFGYSSLYEEHDYVEIIGNIHENPELLERENAKD